MGDPDRMGWVTAPRRALMHSRFGRRLWWRTRTRSEVDFWADWLAGAPGTEQWASDRESRLAPDTEIGDPLLRAELGRIPDDDVSILDVGAGPLTTVGYHYPGKRLTIVPVDPLADEYDRLLRAAGLVPPIRTIRVAGEELLDHFGAGRFDIAYATNSLDHSADPLGIIGNMAAVVRPGGTVLLRHKRNEGESARYGGLHQWNFDVADDRLLLWNNAEKLDVGATLEGGATTTAWIEENEAVARLVVGPSA
ncbi:MAG TPA: methyltransferase domain-containing protein [Gaiellaceae bacterium]|nr:methyltransferase domain-containing protein [Gaiellaceae bacterium]